MELPLFTGWFWLRCLSFEVTSNRVLSSLTTIPFMAAPQIDQWNPENGIMPTEAENAAADAVASEQLSEQVRSMQCSLLSCVNHDLITLLV